MYSLYYEPLVRAEENAFSVEDAGHSWSKCKILKLGFLCYISILLGESDVSVKTIQEHKEKGEICLITRFNQ